MIDNLQVLNDRINSFVNYVVKTACERTTSGNYYVSIEDACNASGLGMDDYLKYRDLIVTELYNREEILEFDYDEKEFDLNCVLDYCPSYQWCEGDERIFKCSFEEWLETPAKAVSQPLSISRMAQIGESAISFVYETSGVALEDLTESMGMSLEELEQLGLYERDNVEPVRKSARATILFFVNDANKTHMYGFESFEEALDAYEKLGPGKDKSISYSRTIPGEHIPRGDLLLKHYPASGRNAPCQLDASVLEDPQIKLAYSKAILHCYPFDEKAWKMRDDAEAALGITDRIVDTSNDLRVGKWRVHIVPVGGRYGQHKALVNDREPSVEFYDMSQDKKMFPDGQFVMSYYASTLLEDSRLYNTPNPPGLSLYDDIPNWTVSGAEMSEVMKYLQKNLAPERAPKPSLAERIQGCEQKLRAAVLESLPERCYVYVSSQNTIGVVRRGEHGIQPFSWQGDPEVIKGMVDTLNNKIGVSKAQAAAMRSGALIGWQDPSANPQNYDVNGNPIKSKGPIR